MKIAQVDEKTWTVRSAETALSPPRSVLCSVRSVVRHVGRVNGPHRAALVRRRHAARCAPRACAPAPRHRRQPLAVGGRRHAWHARHGLLLPRSAEGGRRPLPLRRLHPREDRLGLLLRGLQGTPDALLAFSPSPVMCVCFSYHGVFSSNVKSYGAQCWSSFRSFCVLTFAFRFWGFRFGCVLYGFCGICHIFGFA